MKAVIFTEAQWDLIRVEVGREFYRAALEMEEGEWGPLCDDDRFEDWCVGSIALCIDAAVLSVDTMTGPSGGD